MIQDVCQCLGTVMVKHSVQQQVMNKAVAVRIGVLLNVTVACSSNEFHCNIFEDGCIGNERVCDGWIDCFGAEDEVHCQNYTCLPGMWKC